MHPKFRKNLINRSKKNTDSPFTEAFLTRAENELIKADKSAAIAKKVLFGELSTVKKMEPIEPLFLTKAEKAHFLTKAEKAQIAEINSRWKPNA